jgi:predicted cupin superfamily sugar epimerase
VTADDWIARLELIRHPEGGWYRETYRSSERAEGAALPPRFGGPRAFSTAIYYLLRAGERSALHRIQSDEVWHHSDRAALLATWPGQRTIIEALT